MRQAIKKLITWLGHLKQKSLNDWYLLRLHFGSQVTNEVIMKHFKVTVQYLNGIDFIYECDAQSNWQAAAMARVEGRRMGFGGAMDVKNTITEEC